MKNNNYINDFFIRLFIVTIISSGFGNLISHFITHIE